MKVSLLLFLTSTYKGPPPVDAASLLQAPHFSFLISRHPHLLPQSPPVLSPVTCNVLVVPYAPISCVRSYHRSHTAAKKKISHSLLPLSYYLSCLSIPADPSTMYGSGNPASPTLLPSRDLIGNNTFRHVARPPKEVLLSRHKTPRRPRSSWLRQHSRQHSPPSTAKFRLGHSTMTWQ
jgi:hypothetical protein